MSGFQRLLASILGLMLGVWLIGAVFVMLGKEYDRRSVCIENEGLLKGYFWCETDDNGRFWGINVSLQIIYGLSWPYDVFSKSDSPFASTEFNDPNSPIPNAFLCAFLGSSLGQEPNASKMLLDSLFDFGFEAEKIEVWVEDALIYVKQFVEDEKNTRAYGAWYWTEYCEVPFRIMRE